MSTTQIPLKNFVLEKEIEKVIFVLEKNGIHVVRSKTCLIIDFSGSLEKFARNGVLQNAITRIFPVLMACDTDGKVDVIIFSSDAVVAKQLTADNYSTFVQDIINGRGGRGTLEILWGGTEYAPALRELIELYGLLEEHHGEEEEEHHGEEEEHHEEKGLLQLLWEMIAGESHAEEPEHTEKEEGEHHGEEEEHHGEEEIPQITWFLTDGANDRLDRGETEELLGMLQQAGAQSYILPIAIGDIDLSFLTEIGEEFPNVGLVNIKDLQIFAEDENGTAYELLTPLELCAWIKHDHGDGNPHFDQTGAPTGGHGHGGHH